MGSLEERVAFVEGRVGEQAAMIDGIRQAIVSLEQRMDQRFAGVDQRFVSIDQRFAQIDHRFAQIDQRFTNIDVRFTNIDGRLTDLDTKVSRQFVWMVGLQMTTLVAIVSTLLAALLARP